MTDTATPQRQERWFPAAGMPPWIPRLMLMILVTLAFAFFGLSILQRLRGLLILLLISLFLSVALEPGVNWLSNRGMRRGMATMIIIVAIIAGGSAYVGLMIPLIVDQGIQLIDELPGYLDRLSEFAARFGADFDPDRLTNSLIDFDQELQGIAADVAGRVFGVGTALLTTILQLLTIGLFTFYLTADGPRFRRKVCSLLPPDRQREVLRAWQIAIEKTGGYFYSRALLAAVSATAGYFAFRIIGVPFALTLALWMGVLSQFIPVVGTYLGGALPALIALLDSPAKALAVVVYIVVYQQVENYLLSPKLTEHTMSLHPALSFGSAIAGGTLMGAPGALMALPAAATIQAFIGTYMSRYDVVDSDLLDKDLPPKPGSAR